MGWTFTHRPKGISNKDWFAEQFDWDKGHVIDAACGTLNPNHVFLAYQVESGDIIAIVCLTQRVPKDCMYNYGWKDMDETMLPYTYDCPQRIIDQLTPTEHEDALEWRGRVAEFRRKWDAKPKLEKGKTYTCTHDLDFGYRTIKAGFPFVCTIPRRKQFTTGGFVFRLRKDTIMELEATKGD